MQFKGNLNLYNNPSYVCVVHLYQSYTHLGSLGVYLILYYTFKPALAPLSGKNHLYSIKEANIKQQCKYFPLPFSTFCHAENSYANIWCSMSEYTYFVLLYKVQDKNAKCQVLCTLEGKDRLQRANVNLGLHICPAPYSSP